MFERFSERSRRVLVLAQEEARLLRHRQIGVEHLLLGLLHDSDGFAARALESLGVSLEAARARVAATPSDRSVELQPPLTGAAKRVLARAHQVSLVMDEPTVTTRHLLLGLLDVDDASSSQLLGSFGVTTAHVRSALDALPGVEPDLPRDRPRPRAYFVGARDHLPEPEVMVTTPVRKPPPPELPAELVAELETRCEQLPVHRTRRDADFWALRRVEQDHVKRLARRHQLDEVTREVALDWWLGEVQRRCSEARAGLHREELRRLHRLVRRRYFRPNGLFQLYWNTVGPGGRTWFGNRYVTIRRYTFRIRWRP